MLYFFSCLQLGGSVGSTVVVTDVDGAFVVGGAVVCTLVVGGETVVGIADKVSKV